MGPTQSLSQRISTAATAATLILAGIAALAVVVLADPVGAWADLPRDIRLGVAAVGFLALATLAALLLGLGRSYRTLARLGSALRDHADGEPDPEALRITRESDATAAAWGRLLDDWIDARERADDDHAARQLDDAGRGPADRDGLLDAVAHGVVVIDPKLQITLVNGAACRLLVRSRERLLGAPLDKLLPDDGLTDLIRRVLASPDGRGGAAELTFNAGEEQESVFRATVRPVGRGGRRDALILFEDVTQQRTADRSRNLFVAQATHELRTPLTNIGLYLERAIDLDDAEVAARAECLNVMNQEVLRLGRVVEEVLSVSEIEAGSLQVRRDDVRVDELVRQIEAEFRPHAADKPVTLEIDLPPKCPVLQGDREKLSVALHNLVGNAVKYTPAGGTVRVSVTSDDAEVVVAVSDTGIGIAEHELPKVFEKFYRADDERLRDITGTGLGLALSREVVRLHGGDVTAESILNQGSTFTLRLPASTAAAAA
ncbi:MAG: ATP-binding protein [Planctomycetota bacterium]